MGTAFVIIGFLAALGVAFAYGQWLRKNIQARVFTTSVSPDQLRSIFIEKVASKGWKIVDDGNPMVAQSNLATGVRQQIELRTAADKDGNTTVRIAPARITSKGFINYVLRIPSKGHTLRIRMNSFTKAVEGYDSNMSVQMHALKVR